MKTLQSIRQSVADSLGLDYEEVSINPEDGIISIDKKEIKKFSFLENSDYFICFHKCNFIIDELYIRGQTELILHFTDCFFRAISILGRIKEIHMENSHIHHSFKIENSRFEKLIFIKTYFCNRFEINSTQITESFLVIKNNFLNAPFVLIHSNFQSICILCENIFYEVRIWFCVFASKLDFSLSKLQNPLIFIKNKILDERLINFYFSEFYFDFDMLRYLVKNPENRVEMIPQKIGIGLISIPLSSISFDNELDYYFQGANHQSKPLLQNYQETATTVKKILVNNGNNILASSWHTQSLYCKEIELDSKKPPIFSKDWIDKWQLCLYRHTSDHHTDLLKIISWVIVAIGVFGVINFGIKYLQDPSIIRKLNPNGIILSLVGSILAIPFCITTKKPFFKFERYLTILSSISTLWIAYYKPILIFGAMNLIDKTPRSGFENLLLVLYTLVMILLLFSLQKTARKNSIIPS